MADLSDEELLEAFRAGDHRAFEALVRRYQRPVLGIARRFARDDHAVAYLRRNIVHAAGGVGDQDHLGAGGHTDVFHGVEILYPASEKGGID